MKNILIIVLVSNFLFAGITQEQMDKYVVLSGQSGLLRQTLKEQYETTLAILGVRDSNATPALKKALADFFSDEELTQKFNNTFLNMNTKTYDYALNFYRTEVGKKFALIRPYIYIRRNKDIKKTKQAYNKFLKNGMLNQEKVELIRKILDETEEFKVHKKEFRKYIAMEDLISGIKTENVDKKVRSFIEGTKAIMHPLASIYLSDFTMSELDELYKYYSRKEGKEEIRLQVQALYNESIKFKTKVYNSKQLSLISFCGEFNKIKHPSFCKDEWLSDNNKSNK